MEIKSVDTKDIRKLMEEVALIKQVLSIGKKDPEGELTDWAKKQLEIARKTPGHEYASLEEIEKRIISK
ncbi:MAG: hypothetical protein WD876_03415 [Candidatus Pacearchaeota archaeon]